MSGEAPRKPVDRLEAGDLTLPDALLEYDARTTRIDELVRACPERGNRQTPAILRKALLAPWLEVRHMTEYQRDRLLAVLADEEQPPWPRTRTPLVQPLEPPAGPEPLRKKAA